MSLHCWHYRGKVLELVEIEARLRALEKAGQRMRFVTTLRNWSSGLSTGLS